MIKLCKQGTCLVLLVYCCIRFSPLRGELILSRGESGLRHFDSSIAQHISGVQDAILLASEEERKARGLELLWFLPRRRQR
jgi:hypothetical protein